MLDSPNLKDLGAYYTPSVVVKSLVQWGTQNSRVVRVLDPSCGDGRFLEGLKHAVGVDIDPLAAKAAASRQHGLTIINEDFFHWASRTELRFNAAIGKFSSIEYGFVLEGVKWIARGVKVNGKVEMAKKPDPTPEPAAAEKSTTKKPKAKKKSSKSSAAKKSSKKRRSRKKS